MTVNDLRHPDCRTCEERERVNVGLLAENRSLRVKLAERVKAELHSDDDGTTTLEGPLGEAIAEVAGTWCLEFITPEQLAEGIAAWLVAE